MIFYFYYLCHCIELHLNKTDCKCTAAFRFHGLKVPAANNSLWFYSIQGLFRVAFEMYSKEGQLAVLENFQVALTSILWQHDYKGVFPVYPNELLI